VLGEGLRDGGDAIACAIVAYRQGQRHDGLGEAFQGVGRRALGSFRPFLGPSGMGCIVAMPPRGEPPLRADPLPTDVRELVSRKIGVDGLCTACFSLLGHGSACGS